MITFKSLSNPIMFVSDNPSLPTGLARMCRDLATLTCTLPEFRVAVLGRGIGQCSKFPFVLYDYPESGQWGEAYIQQAWEDFSGGDSGVIMTLDDHTRRHWFANPIGLPDSLAKFLGPGRNFKKWGYFPIDGTGPKGYPGVAGRDCIKRYDRGLAASEFGAHVLQRIVGETVDWLPHGLFKDKFQAASKSSRELHGWNLGDIYIGCVMSNQARKDYPAVFESFFHLKRLYGNKFHAWVHTDELVRYWSIPALAADYDVADCLEVTSNLQDYQLASRYAACDCTLLLSGGEGFGYPIVESLACGTACVVSDYSASPAFLPESCLVTPLAYRVDTQHNVTRCVHDVEQVVERVMMQVDSKRNDWSGRSEELAQRVAHLDWNTLKYSWMRWLREGLV